MKRFTLASALFSVSILGVWLIFQADPAIQSKTKGDTPVVQVENVNGEILNPAIIPVTDTNAMIAPVYDSTGALISDPSGTIRNSSLLRNRAIPATGTEWKVAPVFDDSGAVVSDPSGILLQTNNP